MLALSTTAVVVGPYPLGAEAQRPPRPDPGTGLVSAAGQGGQVGSAADGGPVTFVGTAPGGSITVDGAGATPTVSADAFVGQYAADFGEPTPDRDLRRNGSAPMAAGGESVRYQQFEGGVPVLAGELRVQVSPQGKVRSASGELSTGEAVDTASEVAASAAQATAVASVATDAGVTPGSLAATTPERWVYDPALLGEPDGTRLLVWRTEVRSDEAPVRADVLVDAHSGQVVLAIDEIMNAKDRQVCDNQNVLGDAYSCPGAGVVRSEGGAASGVAEVNKAYELSGATYDFYNARFGRDSIDGAGLTLYSTVRHCPADETCPFANAFWDGNQMVYGDTYAGADDVVGHELTHGVTEYTAGLVYLNQSGAINESMSDVFGEFMDLTYDSSFDNDSAGVRWDMGEDLPIGAIRDMADPGRFGDPDRMGSPAFYTGPDDSGGVHTNSGVNNKAAALLTDGGTFNGYTVTALGIAKVARIYYEALTTMLGSGSDYADLGYALPQACNNAVGQDGIVASDCTQVTSAAYATEMLVPCGAASGVQRGATPVELAQRLVGPGITVSSADFDGAFAAAGCFAGLPAVGFDDGIVLSSGSAADVLGPNDSSSTTTAFGRPGDAQLDALVGGTTYDAAALSITFVPTTSRVNFRYVFSSEEYDEFVGSQFNDVFGFWVNGQNCAQIGSSPVSVNSINSGQLPDLYRPNSGGGLDVEMDGLTTVLTCRANVTAGATNTLRVAIADTSDDVLDSAVFLEQGSLTNAVGVSGAVTSLGSPVAGTFVALLRLSDFSIAAGAVTDAAGNFSAPLPAGSYLLYLVDPNGQHAAGFYAAAGVGVIGRAPTAFGPAPRLRLGWASPGG